LTRLGGIEDGPQRRGSSAHSILLFFDGANGTSYCASRERLIRLRDLQHRQTAPIVRELSRSGAKSLGVLTPVLSMSRKPIAAAEAAGTGSACGCCCCCTTCEGAWGFAGNDGSLRDGARSSYSLASARRVDSGQYRTITTVESPRNPRLCQELINRLASRPASRLGGFRLALPLDTSGPVPSPMPRQSI
jgi:hypothetical protein